MTIAYPPNGAVAIAGAGHPNRPRRFLSSRGGLKLQKQVSVLLVLALVLVRALDSFDYDDEYECEYEKTKLR